MKNAKKKNFTVYLGRLCPFLLLAVIILLPFNTLSQQANSDQTIQRNEELNIKKAFNKVFEIDKPEKIEPLNPGFSGAKLYKILVKNKWYVLRVKQYKVLSSEDLQDRKNDIKCMTIAAKAKVAPKVYYANAEDGIVIMDYINSKTFLTDTEKENPKIISKLATLLRTLHQLTPFPQSPNTPIRYALGENTDISNRMPYKAPLILQAREKLRKIETVLNKTKTSNKSCHNDLNPNNILYDGEKFWIIDWEDASYYDPFFDLATVANFFILNSELEEHYLKTYFKRIPSKKERAHFYVMKQVSLSFFGIGLMNLGKRSGSKTVEQNEIDKLDLKEIYLQIQTDKLSLTNPDHLELFGTAMLKEALSNMRSDYFKKALSLLGS